MDGRGGAGTVVASGDEQKPFWGASILPRQRNLYGKGVTPPDVRVRLKPCKTSKGCEKDSPKLKDDNPMVAIDGFQPGFCVADGFTGHKIIDGTSLDKNIKANRGESPKDPMRHMYKLADENSGDDEDDNFGEARAGDKSIPIKPEGAYQKFAASVSLEANLDGAQSWSEAQRGKRAKASSLRQVGGFRPRQKNISIEEDVRIRSRAASAACKDISRRRLASKSQWLVSELRNNAEQRAAREMEREVFERNVIASSVPTSSPLPSRNKSWLDRAKTPKDARRERASSRQSLLEEPIQRPHSVEHYVSYLQSKFAL